jgi:hypothetical protein
MQAIRSKMNVFLRDTRGGSEFVQMIILVVAVALFGLTAYKYFGERVGQKVRDTGNDVMQIQ